MRRERAESFKCSMWRAHFYRKRVSMPPIAMCTSRFLWPRTRALPGVIVETLVDSEFCSARQNAQSQLAKHKFVLDSQHGGELPLALPVDVRGWPLKTLTTTSAPCRCKRSGNSTPPS